MKTFETVTDVLDNARHFHHYAETVYLGLQRELSNERAKMLLGFMAEHEKGMENTLQQFSRKSPAHILDTWIQFTVEESPKAFFDEAQQGLAHTVDGISAMGQRADSYLEAVFQTAEEMATSGDVKELFGHLVSLEVREKRQLSNATNSLWDV